MCAVSTTIERDMIAVSGCVTLFCCHDLDPKCNQSIDPRVQKVESTPPLGPFSLSKLPVDKIRQEATEYTRVATILCRRIRRASLVFFCDALASVGVWGGCDSDGVQSTPSAATPHHLISAGNNGRHTDFTRGIGKNQRKGSNASKRHKRICRGPELRPDCVARIRARQAGGRSKGRGGSA